MKTNKQVWLDLDDFSEQNNRLDWLWMLKKEFPHFKVNLFTIPTTCTPHFLNYLKQPYMKHWIQLCIHGFYHKNNEDVLEEDLKRIPEEYVKIYRAPFWQLSDKMYNRLKRLDYKIMLHPNDPREGIKYNWNIKDSPPFLDILYGHGHVQDYPIGPKGNGIIQAFENILKLPKNTEFRFL